MSSLQFVILTFYVFNLGQFFISKRFRFRIFFSSSSSISRFCNRSYSKF